MYILYILFKQFIPLFSALFHATAMPYVSIIFLSKRSRAGVALGGFGAVSDFTETVCWIRVSCRHSSLNTAAGRVRQL